MEGLEDGGETGMKLLVLTDFFKHLGRLLREMVGKVNNLLSIQHFTGDEKGRARTSGALEEGSVKVRLPCCPMLLVEQHCSP